MNTELNANSTEVTNLKSRKTFFPFLVIFPCSHLPFSHINLHSYRSKSQFLSSNQKMLVRSQNCYRTVNGRKIMQTVLERRQVGKEKEYELQITLLALEKARRQECKPFSLSLYLLHFSPFLYANYLSFIDCYFPPHPPSTPQSHTKK